MTTTHQIKSISLSPYQPALQVQAISQEAKWNGRVVRLGWPSLPRVLFEQVSTFLTLGDLSRLASVCKSWKSTITDTNSICTGWKLDITKTNSIWSWEAHRLGIGHSVIEAVLRDYRADDGSRFNCRILHTIAQYDDHVIENARQLVMNPHPAIAFGKEEWIRYIGDPGDVPSLPPTIYKTLQGPCPFWPGKTIEETHMLVLIPRTVTRAGRKEVSLTVSNFDKLLKPYDIRLSTYGYSDTRTAESHWVLMTNEVIPGSQDKSYVNQKALVKNAGYEIPRVLEALVFISFKYIRWADLFDRGSQEEETYTRCQEAVVVCESGPGLSNSGFWRVDSDVDSTKYQFVGVTAMRKLSGHFN